jgi:hypothetical protein
MSVKSKRGVPTSLMMKIKTQPNPQQPLLHPQRQLGQLGNVPIAVKWVTSRPTKSTAAFRLVDPHITQAVPSGAAR